MKKGVFLMQSIVIGILLFIGPCSGEQSQPLSPQDMFEVRWEQKLEDCSNPVRAVHAQDMNGDGTEELFLACGAVIYKIDPLTGRSTLKIEAEHTIYSMFVDSEYVVVGDVNSVYSIPSLTIRGEGQILKQFVGGAYGEVRNVFSADINEDGGKEIVFSSGPSAISLYDVGKENISLVISLDKPLISLNVFDLDGDGKKEIIAGTSSGIEVFNCDGTKKWEMSDSNIITSNITAVFSTKQGVVAGGDDGKIYAISTGGILKHARKIVNGSIVALWIADIDNQAGAELIIGIKDEGIVIFGRKNNDYSDYGKEGAYDLAIAGGPASMFVSDIDGNGAEDIIIGTEKGSIYNLQFKSGKNYTPKEVADMQYSKAVEAFDRKDYDGAISYINNAKRAYTLLNDAKGIENCEKILSEIDKINKKRSAERYLSDAEDFEDTGKYEDAMASLKTARDLYHEIGDSAGVDVCNNRIENIKNKTKPLLGLESNQILLIGAVIIVLIIAAAVMFRKKEKTPEELSHDSFELLRERKEDLKRRIKKAQIKYNRREIDEEIFKSLLRKYEMEIIEIESKMDALSGEKKESKAPEGEKEVSKEMQEKEIKTQ